MLLVTANTVSMLSKLKSAWSLTNWRRLRLRYGRCSLCGPALLVKLDDNELAIRCMRCGSSAISMCLVAVMRDLVPDLHSKSVYELSSRGPLVNYLRQHAAQLTVSEYFDRVPPGDWQNGVQCQDVQCLTYPNAAFDLCTSTEVFEHVPDDRKGFAEIYRVLKTNGLFLFTVPLSQAPNTVERAQFVDGELRHLLPPEYHGDHIRGSERVLCFRNYANDIVDRLKEQGFTRASIVMPQSSAWWGYTHPVIAAHK